MARRNPAVNDTQGKPGNDNTHEARKMESNNNATHNDTQRRAYWEHAQRALGREFKRFANGLASQSPTQQQLGRTARVEFAADGSTTCRVFRDSIELQSFLDNRGSQSLQKSSPCRELYLLEDLGRANMEILGSRLRIPPEVFALQWDMEDVMIAPVDRKTIRVNRYHNIRLAYPVMYRLQQKIGTRDTERPPGLYIDRMNNIPRTLQPLDENRDMESSTHLAGFWSNESPDGSWTALLLVDPVMREVRLEASLFEDVDTELRSLKDDFEPLGLLPVSSDDSGTPLPRLMDFHPLHNNTDNNVPSPPYFVSIFEDLVRLYSSERLRKGNSDNPHESALYTCMPLVSRYVALLMHGWVQAQMREYWQLYDKLHLACYSPHALAAGGSSTSWFQTWDLGKWRAETFRQLTFGSFMTDLMAETIESDIRVLGVNRGTYSVLSEDETEMWQAVADSIAGLQRKFGALLAAYVQEASLHESQIANHQARNVGRLTALATLLVPVSISAAIFSMGGDYLAGESKFWVFWVVSLPIVSVFALLVFTKALSQSVEVFGVAVERTTGALKRVGLFGSSTVRRRD